MRVLFAILSEEMKRVLCMTGVASAGEITKAILIRDELGGERWL